MNMDGEAMYNHSVIWNPSWIDKIGNPKGVITQS